MRGPRHTTALVVGMALVAAAAVAGSVRAAEPPLDLRWDQLVPAGPPKQLKSFLANRPVDIGKMGGPHDGSPAPAPQQEGRWMSGASKAATAPVPVVQELDGKRVRIGGYVVPLDFEATRVKEFLLVPFVGACIHVPPPPANQIVYVKAEQGFDVKGTFDPVWVTGAIKVTPVFTGLADTGYSIDAEKVEARAPGG